MKSQNATSILPAAHSVSKRLMSAFLVVFLTLVNGAGIYAQEETPPNSQPSAPKTPQQEALEQEVALLKLKKERATLLKDIRDAQPVPSVTSLEGKATLNSVTIEPEMMAYRAMTNVAYIISGDIHNSASQAKAIAIYNAKDVKEWRFYQAMYPLFETQLTGMKTRYEELLPKTAADKLEFQRFSLESNRAVESLLGGAFIGSSLIKSFIDLTSFFRTDTEITGVTVEVNESALVSEVIRALKERYGNINIYNPAVVPPQVLADSPTLTLLRQASEKRLEGDRFVRVMEAMPNIVKEASERREALKTETAKLEEESAQKSRAIEANDKEIVKLRAKLKRTRSRAARQKIEKQIESLEAKNTTLKTEVEELATNRQDKVDESDQLKIKIDKLQQTIEKNKDKVAEVKALNDQFDSFLGEFLKGDAATGQNAVTVFVKSENLNKIFEQEAYWLEIKPIKAGGNNRTRRNLVRYITGPKVDHSGGFIVEYALYDKTGLVKISDKYAKYEGYKEPKEIIGWVDEFDKGQNKANKSAVGASSSTSGNRRK